MILYFRVSRLSIFEIYPQSEIPLLTPIAHFDLLHPREIPAHLLPDTLICRIIHNDRIDFKVVDYRTNYSTRFSAEVNVYDNVEVFFVLSKTLKLAPNHLLGRHSRRRQLSSSSVKKEY